MTQTISNEMKYVIAKACNMREGWKRISLNGKRDVICRFHNGRIMNWNAIQHDLAVKGLPL